VASVSIGTIFIAVPDGMEHELQNLAEGYRNDGEEEHEFETMEEMELRFLVADALDIGVTRVEVWPQIQIKGD
jgi:hypothetical protein